jgi:hypothetical protein
MQNEKPNLVGRVFDVKKKDYSESKQVMYLGT